MHNCTLGVEFGDQGDWKSMSLRAEDAELSLNGSAVSQWEDSQELGRCHLWLCGLVVGGMWTMMVMYLERSVITPGLRTEVDSLGDDTTQEGACSRHQTPRDGGTQG